MAKRNKTLKDFTSCFVVLSQIDNVDLSLDDFLVKYVDYLKERESSEKFLVLKVTDLANLITNLDKVNAICKKNAKIGLKKLLFLKLKVINTFPEQNKVVVKKLSTPKKIAVKPGEMKNIEKEIVEFLQTQDKVRSLDIINRFSALHPRSVKRYLSNLVKGGYIQKEAEGRATFYSKK
jgi:hypothetical protein